MVRGRRENPEAAPSRQLQISRAFRQRRAQDLQAMKDRLSQLETENEQLRKDTQLLNQQVWNCRGTGRDPNGFPTEQQQACGRCSGLQLELERLRNNARQFDRTEPHVQAPLPSSSSYASGSQSTSPSSVASSAQPSMFMTGPPQAAVSGPAASFNGQTVIPVGQQHLVRPLNQLGVPSSIAPTPSSTSTMSPPDGLRASVSSGSSSSYDVQRVWEESVRANGGNPNACCSGFFTCDENGHILVPPSPKQL